MGVGQQPDCEGSQTAGISIVLHLAALGILTFGWSVMRSRVVPSIVRSGWWILRRILQLV
ncbi:hypothetical protein GCM10011575_46860 [Microlunatus endophyticus]|uniref:Uncharacterized protein n=1 Tax=Microlunatus endophyticus TaxID=1716077 RepID=A0A917SJ22_9ACTN|nr:hypothetical protein [Microlunatus endophyticus]GGL83185.1 hypothetical protein GCM10011575_46860 [Microlunatus endophyticus]